MRCGVARVCILITTRIQASLFLPWRRRVPSRPAGAGSGGCSGASAAGGSGPAERGQGSSSACLGAAGRLTWRGPASRLPRRGPLQRCCRIPGRAKRSASLHQSGEQSSLRLSGPPPRGADAGPAAALGRRVSTASASGARAGRPEPQLRAAGKPGPERLGAPPGPWTWAPPQGH